MHAVHIKQKAIVSIIITLIMFVICSPVIAQEIIIVTEDYPPYSYLSGEIITGMSTEIVLATTEAASVPYTLGMYPWARAYKMALLDKNTLIYSIGKSADREKLFNWIGVIAPVEYCLLSL